MNRSPLLELQIERMARTEARITLMPILSGTWEMPADYGVSGGSGEPWRHEYGVAMQGAGMIDRSCRAALQLRGRDRRTFLQGMVTNDVLALQPGQGCRAAMLDVTAHIQADMRVHALSDKLIIETDPRIAGRLAEALEKYLIMEKVAIEDVSGEWAVITVLGPKADEILASVFGVTGLDSLPRRGHAELEGGFIVAQADARVPGYDVWLLQAKASEAWTKLAEAGVAPVGERAAETLRIEAGTAAWGSELDETVLLPEAEIPDIVSYTKGCYIGQEIIARLRARGHTNRALRAILLDEGASAVPGDTVLADEESDQPGREIGRITSVAVSPANGDRMLALAYVRKEFAEDGTVVGEGVVRCLNHGFD